MQGDKLGYECRDVGSAQVGDNQAGHSSVMPETFDCVHVPFLNADSEPDPFDEMLNDIALYKAIASDLPPLNGPSPEEPTDDTASTKKNKPRRRRHIPRNYRSKWG